MEKPTLQDKLLELEQAKINTTWLLDHDGLVDMHGLKYWAGRVESLRELIKNSL
jgi:hypothetical protein